MMSPGQAFVAGYLVCLFARAVRNKPTYPWSPGLWTWGVVFMGLNWLGGLG